MMVEDRRFDWLTSPASPHLTNVGHPLGHLRWTGKGMIGFRMSSCRHCGSRPAKVGVE